MPYYIGDPKRDPNLEIYPFLGPEAERMPRSAYDGPKCPGDPSADWEPGCFRFVLAGLGFRVWGLGFRVCRFVSLCFCVVLVCVHMSDYIYIYISLCVCVCLCVCVRVHTSFQCLCLCVCALRDANVST